MFKLRTFALVVIVAAALTSCDNKSKLLVKTWSLEDMKPEKPVPEQTKGFFEALRDHTKKYYRLTYKADGTYDLNDGHQELHGTWKLLNGGKQLQSTADGGQPMTIDVAELTEKSLVWSAVINEEKMTYYMVPATGSSEKAPAPAPATAAGDTSAQKH